MFEIFYYYYHRIGFYILKITTVHLDWCINLYTYNGEALQFKKKKSKMTSVILQILTILKEIN